jgi:hypothetical protein
LANSILWFDSRLSGDLSFLSSAVSNYNPRVPQVIATEETIRILEAYRRRPNALVCQYNRPFSIGRLKMELLPSGCVLGGASLYVETEKGRLLYAPQLQPQRIPTVRQMQLKRANVLVLGAAHPDPTAAMPNRKKERERLLEVVTELTKKGQWPVIVCEPFAVAQELTKLLTDAELPVAVHDAIFRVNRVYESYGSKLGGYTRYTDRLARARGERGKVTIFPLRRSGPPSRSALPDGPVVYVESSLDDTPPPAAFRQPAARFHLGPTCDGPEMREIVAAVGPKELVLFGPYAKRYVEEFKGLCPTVRQLLSNDQPTLF